MVVEPGIRVLYVEGTLRAEYGALVDRFLAKDPDLEFCALVQTRPNVFLKRTNIEGLDARRRSPPTRRRSTSSTCSSSATSTAVYFQPEQQELFVKRVRDGAGLVMLGGYHSLGPGGYAGTPLGEILPVEPGNREIGQITDPFLPTLTPEGARHPIFANIADFFPTEAGEPKTPGLPPLLTAARGSRRPGPAPPCWPPARSIRGRRRCWPSSRWTRDAPPSSPATRRGNWQQGPRALDQDSPFLRFWGQMVRWLAGRTGTVEATAGVVGSTDKAYYEPDEPIGISAVVRDDKGEGAGDAKVVARIAGPGRPRPDRDASRPCPGPSGHYGGTLRPGHAGHLRDRGRSDRGRREAHGREARGRRRPAEPRIREARPRREDARPHRRRHRRTLRPHHHGRPA